MKTVCLGGGPAGLYFAISLKLRQPDAQVTVLERNRADDTFGWGVVLSDETLDNLAENDPRERRGDPHPVRLLGRHQGDQGRHGDHLDRPRLLRPRAQDPAAPVAGPRPRARRRAALRDRGGRHRGADEGQRPRRRRRRHQFEDAPAFRRRLQSPRSTPAPASSSGSARMRSSTTPSPSSSRGPMQAGSGPTPTSSTRIPRRSSSNAPRTHGAASGSTRWDRTR